MGSRRYSELVQLTTFEQRFAYLRLEGSVGAETFGFDRYLGQGFYRSREWARVRDSVIVRDNGCDLGVPGHEITERPLVHHMNPMVVDDILHNEEWILDPEHLILTKHRTHNAIHYGVESLTPPVVIERTPGDTKLW